jgi:hypothetical protein
VRPQTVASIPGDNRPTAFWFLGWEGPPDADVRLRAEIRCVGAVAADWPDLARAFSRLRLPSADGGRALVTAVGCTVSWQGSAEAATGEFGPPLVESSALDLAGAHTLVLEHPLRTLDAIHLAVALGDASELAAGEPVIFVTRDQVQAEAARALGLETE